ncbi:hypothetical protein NTE19_003321 [Vibrio fluvialis]|nr:hypothetical protein [Vibrio fluvialis]
MTNTLGKARKVHIHMSIPHLLSLSDKKLTEMVTHPDGVLAAREELKSILDEGETCLVMDSTCDNKKPDGSCAGHLLEGGE